MPPAESADSQPPSSGTAVPPSPPGRSDPSRRSRLNLLAAAGPLTVAGLVAAGALVLWAAWRVLQPLPERTLVLATGPEQGAYEEFARRYQPLLEAQGLRVVLRSSQGSGDNLALLRDPRSGVQAAFVQGGALLSAPAGDDATQGLLSLGQVALEPLWIFYRVDRLSAAPATAPTTAPAATSASTPVATPAAAARSEPHRAPHTPPASTLPTAPDRLSQLAGWRIDTGPVGGGSGLLFRQLAGASGLPDEGLLSPARPAALSVADLVQGRSDAVALVSAADAPLVQYLLATPDVRLLNLAQAPAYERRFPVLRALTLPRGTADPATDQPPQDVQMVATQATLAVRADLHPALMHLLLQAAHQVHGGPGWFHRSGEFPHAGSDELPLADEAARYYRDGPPWLQRHLPFWLAHVVDRMWIVLLPLLAALWPLSRIVPPLVTLRLRSRVYRWYAHLREIESALEAPAPDLPGLLTRLDTLDAQTERIGLPLSFTSELYDLRGHIHLVRKRLLARTPAAPVGPEPPATPGAPAARAAPPANPARADTRAP